MKWECPVKHLTGSPNSSILPDSLLNFQMRMVLSLELEIRTWVSSFYLWACPVSMAVTQSEWPSRCPISLEVMLLSTSVIKIIWI